jgi:hypothetical protein
MMIAYASTRRMAPLPLAGEQPNELAPAPEAARGLALAIVFR